MKTVFFKNNFPIQKQRINFLLNKAKSSKLGHARLCFHKSRLSNIQQMLICTLKRSTFYLHKHNGMFKSYVLICGKLKFIQIKKRKKITRNYLSTKTNFIHVFEPNSWHTIKTLSKYALFVETRDGPYLKSKILWKPIDFARK